MNRLANFKKIKAESLLKLAGQGIRTTGDLWEATGPKSSGAKKLAQKVGLAEADLVDILAEAAREPEPESGDFGPRFKFWLGNYWPEALALGLVLILLGLLVGNAVRPRDTVVVEAAAALPAFHIIRDSDVKVVKRYKTYGSFAAEPEVVGRYLLRQAAPEDILLSSHLGARAATPEELSGRALLSVPVRGGAISPTLSPPARVRLLFSPRERDDKAAAAPPLVETTVEDVLVLAVRREADASSVVVAVREGDDLAKATSLLGTSDVFLSQPAP